MAVECCKDLGEKNDGVCSKACYSNELGWTGYERLAAYAKCPTHYDCGH